MRSNLAGGPHASSVAKAARSAGQSRRDRRDRASPERPWNSRWGHVAGNVLLPKPKAGSSAAWATAMSTVRITPASSRRPTGTPLSGLVGPLPRFAVDFFDFDFHMAAPCRGAGDPRLSTGRGTYRVSVVYDRRPRRSLARRRSILVLLRRECDARTDPSNGAPAQRRDRASSPARPRVKASTPAPAPGGTVKTAPYGRSPLDIVQFVDLALELTLFPQSDDEVPEYPNNDESQEGKGIRE